MPLNDNATLVIGSGNFLTAPVGTAKPSDLLAPASPWDKVGHTSLEDIFGIESEGGEATTLGTLQSKVLRTKYSPRTEKMKFTLQQFDRRSLRLYFGSNAPVLGNGDLGVPTDPAVTTVAFCIIFLDGTNVFSLYMPKAEVFRGDDPSLTDTESLAGLPIAVTPIVYASNTWAYSVSPLGVIVATGATSGIPGTFTPAGAEAPLNLAAMSGITASPSSSWTTGQYVTLDDASKAHWNSTAWVAGPKP